MTNTAAHHFSLLRAAWSIDAASHAVEVHAANLTASIAASGPEHVATLTLAANRSLRGLRLFLATRGIQLIAWPATHHQSGTITKLTAHPNHYTSSTRHDYDPLAVVRERDAVTN